MEGLWQIFGTGILIVMHSAAFRVVKLGVYCRSHICIDTPYPK